jgi:phage tail sheath protein FI
VRHFYDNGGAQARVLRIAGADGDAIAPNDTAFVQALDAAFAAGGPIDRIDAFNLICVPGLTEAAATAMLQEQAVAHRAFLIADCDERAQAASVAASLAGITGTNAVNSALYFPWVMASDPLQSGAVRAFPPSGFVAGVFARIDAARGIWRRPAGGEANLKGAADLAVHLTDTQGESLNGQGINCLRQFPGRGALVWGARTLDGSDARASEWKYVPVRRTALFLEESIRAGSEWAVFEPNAEPLWSRLRTSVGNFMHGLFKQGAFQGNTPKDAYFVKCDRDTTTQDDIDRGVVNIMVGFAPLKPAEFIVVTIAQLACRH